MCLADLVRLEDAPALTQRLRNAAEICTQEQLGLAMLLVMAADMIEHQRELLEEREPS